MKAHGVDSIHVLTLPAALTKLYEQRKKSGRGMLAHHCDDSNMSDASQALQAIKSRAACAGHASNGAQVPHA